MVKRVSLCTLCTASLGMTVEGSGFDNANKKLNVYFHFTSRHTTFSYLKTVKYHLAELRYLHVYKNKSTRKLFLRDFTTFNLKMNAMHLMFAAYGKNKLFLKAKLRFCTAGEKDLGLPLIKKVCFFDDQKFSSLSYNIVETYKRAQCELKKRLSFTLFWK